MPTALLAAAISMNATTDIDLGYDSVYVDWLPEAVEAGLVQQSTIDAAVRRSLMLRFRLGDFDPARCIFVVTQGELCSAFAYFSFVESISEKEIFCTC